ncbi:MAG: DUF1028 domain-containing protein [Robiginitomaculum sp.]|nr:DUF1028 domain-containing protein [Robiginitomaculum sp.]MDQ7078839.1 DUF1028 domain-containing protein [Robiginitomaculum sp.]
MSTPLIAMAALAALAASSPKGQTPVEGRAMRPAHTFSIVARDAKTGQLGAAVQSHWFSVGSGVIWAEPGVGAVATQSFVDPSYGPLGLKLMRAGKSAPETLKGLLATDEHEEVRQVGMVDAKGRVANHTGSKAIIAHCKITGDGYAVQANLMERDTVCAAMAEAFENTDGDLAARFMAALDAAQGEGGDIRGKQSAAMLIVRDGATLPPWSGRVFDLRVEDSPEPLKELRRLVGVARTYALMGEGDEYMTAGNVEAALASYTAAEKLAPDNHEALYWHAVTLASIGRVDEALPLFQRAFKVWPKWRELTKRLPASGLLPDDKEMMDKIINLP